MTARRFGDSAGLGDADDVAGAVDPGDADDVAEPAVLDFAWRSGGGVRLDARGALHVRRADGSRTLQPLAAEISWPTPVVGVAAASGDSALIGFTLHPLLVHVCARRESPRRIALGERIAHAEQLEVVAATGGFLVRLESGLVFIDEAGRDRWHVDRVTFDWRFVAERDDALWLVDEGGNLLGFGLHDGLERS